MQTVLDDCRAHRGIQAVRYYAEMLRESRLRTRIAYWLLERRWVVLAFLFVHWEDEHELEYRYLQDPRFNRGR